MRGLIIGGTGTISTSVVNYFQDKKIQLTILNRQKNSHRIVNQKKNKSIKIDYYKSSKDNILKLLDNYYDFVINFNIFDEEQSLRDIDIFKDKTKKYFFISSTAIFADEDIINENTSKSNKWLYAKNKIKCEQIFKNEFEKNEFPIIIIRPSHTVNDFTFPTHIQGLGFGINKLINLNKKIITFKNTNKYWSFISSIDFAKIMYKILMNKDAIGNDFNVVNEDYFYWNKYFETIEDLFQKKINIVYENNSFFSQFSKNIHDSIVFDKLRNRKFDTTKLNKFNVNIQKKMNYKQIMENSYDWHLNKSNQYKIIFNKTILNKYLDLTK